jgi:hypothetical protein
MGKEALIKRIYTLKIDIAPKQRQQVFRHISWHFFAGTFVDYLIVQIGANRQFHIRLI